MSNEILTKYKCDNCGKEVIIKVPQNTPEPDEQVSTPTKVKQVPPIKCKNLKPVGDIIVYRISSEQIKEHIVELARQYVSDVRIIVAPRYCEKKRKNNNEPHRSYASLRIAFSDNIVEQREDYGWYGAVGENGSNVKLHSSIMKHIIDKFKYNRKQIEGWLKNYKALEELEDGLGMTEAYINDIRLYATPQLIKADGKENWIFFSAAPENIIADMLTNPNTGNVQGRIQIQDVYPISKDIVEFVVYVHPTQMKFRENPHVRQILNGEEKPKK